ncbi:methyl-accepting chemotaxis domain protein [Vibrio cholerae]|nr:methyl-accepting chemotaxis domain protein [Vibrio cholerae]
MTSVSLRYLSIRNRLFLLTVVILVLLAIPFTIMVKDYRHDLMLENKFKLSI